MKMKKIYINISCLYECTCLIFRFFSNEKKSSKILLFHESLLDICTLKLFSLYYVSTYSPTIYNKVKYDCDQTG